MPLTVEEILELAGNVSSLQEVRELVATGRELRSEDVGPLLRQCTALTKLDLDSNELTSVDFLKDLKDLEELSLNSNEITAFPNDLRLEKLHMLDFVNNHVSDMSFLRGCPNVNRLYCFQNSSRHTDNKYFATLYCPKLREIDGDPAEKVRHCIEGFREGLTPLVMGVWEAHFASTTSPEQLKTDEKLRGDVALRMMAEGRKITSQGLNDLPEFRELFIERFVNEKLDEIASGSMETGRRRRRKPDVVKYADEFLAGQTTSSRSSRASYVPSDVTSDRGHTPISLSSDDDNANNSDDSRTPLTGSKRSKGRRRSGTKKRAVKQLTNGRDSPAGESLETGETSEMNAVKQLINQMESCAQRLLSVNPTASLPGPADVGYRANLTTCLPFAVNGAFFTSEPGLSELVVFGDRRVEVLLLAGAEAQVIATLELPSATPTKKKVARNAVDCVFDAEMTSSDENGWPDDSKANNTAVDESLLCGICHDADFASRYLIFGGRSGKLYVVRTSDWLLLHTYQLRPVCEGVKALFCAPMAPLHRSTDRLLFCGHGSLVTVLRISPAGRCELVQQLDHGIPTCVQQLSVVGSVGTTVPVPNGHMSSMSASSAEHPVETKMDVDSELESKPAKTSDVYLACATAPLGLHLWTVTELFRSNPDCRQFRKTSDFIVALPISSSDCQQTVTLAESGADDEASGGTGHIELSRRYHPMAVVAMTAVSKTMLAVRMAQQKAFFLVDIDQLLADELASCSRPPLSAAASSLSSCRVVSARPTRLLFFKSTTVPTAVAFHSGTLAASAGREIVVYRLSGLEKASSTSQQVFLGSVVYDCPKMATSLTLTSKYLVAICADVDGPTSQTEIFLYSS